MYTPTSCSISAGACSSILAASVMYCVPLFFLVRCSAVLLGKSSLS